ncbi:MAG: GNAT family N-acetyltransferase [Nocardioidaceae bacterium]
MEIRPMTDDDIAAVLRLNSDSVWALSPLDADKLEAYRTAAAFALVCAVDGAVAAFTIAYAPGAAYGSINYQWHAERFDDFVYLDRIAVDPAFRRRGIAGAMYDVVEAAAKPHGRMVCEVYSNPPNTGSLAFHEARGYREVGHLVQANGSTTVMLEKAL